MVIIVLIIWAIWRWCGLPIVRLSRWYCWHSMWYVTNPRVMCYGYTQWNKQLELYNDGTDSVKNLGNATLNFVLLHAHILVIPIRWEGALRQWLHTDNLTWVLKLLPAEQATLIIHFVWQWKKLNFYSYLLALWKKWLHSIKCKVCFRSY